ncbi:Ig-like domain-containing protein [Clostridium sp. YIM B02555]|uniref:Ig-like domain-containing protein n=1 Tax=Clostridium sp. YIM B02555 TaxID=2911968 RepID=UPI001EEE0D84|nr:Ig-like domain-containing protein [Clostridium sp. YIM B02555]
MKNYFKKFSIMFIMCILFIGIGMIQNADVANAVTKGDTIADVAENGWQRYDDGDNRITYTDNWQSSSELPLLYKNTQHWIHPTGNESIRFTFYGSKLRYYTCMNNSCSSSVRINIDGNEEYFNTYSTMQYTTPNQAKLAYEKTNMSLGFHTVVVNVNMNISGIYNGWRVLALDGIEIDKDGYLLPYDSSKDIPKSISLNKSTTNLTIGDSETLISTTTPAGINVKWSSSDTSVATVDSNGKVTTIGAGTATITATTLDGSNLSATCVVTVTPKGTDPNPQPTDTDKIVNIAHAKGDNTNNAGGDVTIIFHGSADTTLSVVKTADVKEVWIGDNFTYTLVITNTGTKTAKAVVVNDPAPNHIDFNVSGVTTTQGSVDSSSTSKNIIVNVGDIPPAGTVTIKVPATVIL